MHSNFGGDPEQIKLRLVLFSIYFTYTNGNLLTFTQTSRHAHEALHKAHKGHESMHAQMLMILLVTVLVAQVVLVEWRKRHFRSYQVLIKQFFLFGPFL